MSEKTKDWLVKYYVAGTTNAGFQGAVTFRPYNTLYVYQSNIRFMKQLLLLSLLFIGSISCKKDKDISPEVLKGTWELRRQQTDVLAVIEPGKGEQLRFTGNSYEVRWQDRVTRSGTFRLTKGFNVSGALDDRIIFDNHTETGATTFYQLTGDSLTIKYGSMSNNGGGMISSYKKISN